jgi:ethanolamine utilization cobalamin adenosyltransferase
MLYTEESVRANIRNRDGKRVFFLGSKDTLTPGARDFLTRERIEIRSAEEAAIREYRLLNGAILAKKPEQMTHLHGDVLVPKTHPRIAFRGAMDTLEAELLWCQAGLDKPFSDQIGEILVLARNLIRCEVMSEPVKLDKLCGLTETELRARSHRPQDYYGQPHFMPSATDGQAVLLLNRCRCAVRAAELAAAHAFTDTDGNCTRSDILQALNRMSSMVYILMIQKKSTER